MTTNTDPVRTELLAIAREMKMRSLDGATRSALSYSDDLRVYADRLRALASAPPSAPTLPEFRVGVDVTRDGAQVVVLRCEGDAGEVIYSEMHPLPPSAPVGVDGLAGLLEQIRDLLSSLPVDCLGTDTTADGQPYLIRDEVIHGITKALAQQPAVVDGAARLTERQAVIVTGYTGVLCCKFDAFHADLERRAGRRVWTHEMGNHEWIKPMYRDDFLALAAQQPEAPAQEVGAVEFTNLGDSEAQFIADSEALNCPSCGGSGHAGDAPQPAIPDGMVLVQRRDAQCLIDNAPDCPQVLLAARRVRDLLRTTQEPDHAQ